MPTGLEQEIGHGNTGLTPWSTFVDVTETVPELAWPNSINTYSAMRTDAQIASLLLAFTLLIRRYRWYIGPNGARDEVMEDLANDFNLPIEGPRSRADNQTWRFGSVTAGRGGIANVLHAEEARLVSQDQDERQTVLRLSSVQRKGSRHAALCRSKIG
jgi:hypothetical protein